MEKEDSPCNLEAGAAAPERICLKWASREVHKAKGQRTPVLRMSLELLDTALPEASEFSM